ncbi:MAG: peptidase M28, partial [Flavobacterium sp.]|nr:peptidase M28 [Flavobacterium sp.]
SKFTYKKATQVQNITKPGITFLKDSVNGNFRVLKIKISPNRNVNRYDIFANKKMEIYNLTANSVRNINQKTNKLQRKDERILSYYVVDNLPLELSFSIPTSNVFDMHLIESSFDLLEEKNFNIGKRQNWMTPVPFVLNDAILIKMKIRN